VARRTGEARPGRSNKHNSVRATVAEELFMVTDRVIFACTIVIAAVYLWATTLIPSLEIGDPLGPKAFPRLLGVALLIAAGLLLMEMLKERKKATQPAPAAPLDWATYRVIAAVAVWTAVYYIVFDALGYILATSAYLLPLMAWFHRGKWTANVLSAVLFSVGSYIMFVKLDVNLPHGVEAVSWASEGVIRGVDGVIGLVKPASEAK
jgi:putative tricarboxylic transport membrane protein